MYVFARACSLEIAVNIPGNKPYQERVKALHWSTLKELPVQGTDRHRNNRVRREGRGSEVAVVTIECARVGHPPCHSLYMEITTLGY